MVRIKSYFQCYYEEQAMSTHRCVQPDNIPTIKLMASTYRSWFVHANKWLKLLYCINGSIFISCSIPCSQGKLNTVKIDHCRSVAFAFVEFAFVYQIRIESKHKRPHSRIIFYVIRISSVSSSHLITFYITFITLLPCRAIITVYFNLNTVVRYLFERFFTIKLLIYRRFFRIKWRTLETDQFYWFSM